jgi:hypothetical protein
MLDGLAYMKAMVSHHDIAVLINERARIGQSGGHRSAGRSTPPWFV